ncbi:MAG: hypothetical protein ACXW5U_25945 [Thermoanaerobaculia bacterium]
MYSDEGENWGRKPTEGEIAEFIRENEPEVRAERAKWKAKYEAEWQAERSAAAGRAAFAWVLFFGGLVALVWIALIAFATLRYILTHPLEETVTNILLAVRDGVIIVGIIAIVLYVVLKVLKRLLS